jgi:tetratricopeptide (TPR) repeat protein
MVFTHCAPCHRPGQAGPFSLLTYEDVRQRATLIVSATESRYMPPWKPEPGYGDFDGARVLTDRQIALFRQWLDQGLPRGNPSDLPPMPAWNAGWQLGSPDLVLTMPEAFVLGANGPDVLRTFVIPIPTDTRRYLKALEFDPGNAKAVHHANIKIDRTRQSRRLDEEEPGPGYDGSGSREARFPDGNFLGWTPGQSPRVSAPEMAWRLEPDSDLVVELHLMPTGKAETVRVRVGLFFTSEPPPRRIPYMVRLGRQDIDIAAGDSNYENTDSYTLPVDVDLLEVQPHAHYLAKEVEGYAVLPDGTRKWLIFIKSWDFNWQDVYRFSSPVSLPKGTTLMMRYRYDNSAGNPRNPNHPPKRVTFGQASSSEMGSLWMQVLPRNADDLQVLDQDFAPKLLREDIAGVEKMIATNPNSAALHASLASCYLEAGRNTDAIGELDASVRLDPTFARHYELGKLLLGEKRLDEAASHLGEAVRLKPDFAEGFNDLGIVRHLQGNLEVAIQWYARALQVAPTYAEALFNLGRALSAQGKQEEAIARYRRALELRPDDAEFHSTLGSLLGSSNQSNQIEEAVVHLRRALELQPDLPAALVDLAWILATSDRPDVRAPDEAVRLAERVAELTGRRDATALDTLAAAYAAAGRVENAVTTARAALALASAAGDTELASRIRLRLAFYEQHRP